MNPTRYAFLSEGGAWTGARLVGLSARPDGRLGPTAASVAGVLEAGPLDAGEDGRWSRVAVTAETPLGAVITLETAGSPDPVAAPSWQPAPVEDTLVAGERYLWLRLTVRSGPDASAPLIAEIRAETEPDGYLDDLPAVYASSDTDGFLRRLLTLAQSSLGDLQASIDLLAGRFNAATAPPGTLPWLAGWQALDLPAELLRGDDPDRLRALLAELPDLYARRGTPAGVARMVEIRAGVRPAFFEDFRHRAGWPLGHTGALGLDTALAGSSPDGIVLDTTVNGHGTVEDPRQYGRGVFGDTAHRFTAVVPAGRSTHTQRQRVAEAIDAEKPAHTVHHLCFAGPAFRVGVQATVGVDAIVGRSPVQIELT